jgi:hypothetical protein
VFPKVPGVDDEQPARRAAKQVAVPEIPVLCYENTVTLVGERRKRCVGSPVSFREPRRSSARPVATGRSKTNVRPAWPRHISGQVGQLTDSASLTR